jgi:hypothetical protein
MRKVTIIKLGYQSFALTNKTDAAKLIDLMSKIIPVDSDYVEDISRVLFPKEKPLDVSVEFNQDFYPAKPSSPSRHAKSPRRDPRYQDRQFKIGGGSPLQLEMDP